MIKEIYLEKRTDKYILTAQIYRVITNYVCDYIYLLARR
jgi:hypothetical protein